MSKVVGIPKQAPATIKHININTIIPEEVLILNNLLSTETILASKSQPLTIILNNTNTLKQI